MILPAVPFSQPPTAGPIGIEIDKKSGLLLGVRQILSPNCDNRPEGVTVDLIVIHCISLPPEQFGGPWIEALFTNTLEPAFHPYFQKIQGLRVSAHLLIRRDGEVTQYVPFHRRAWHAGHSAFAERKGCNDFAIGIELEGSNEIAYTELQYRQLTSIIEVLMRAYPAITPGRIVGHADIAPGRKTDPGSAFDWHRLLGPLAK